MDTVRLTRVGHPLENQQVEAAPPGPGDVVVEVRASGICHSDVHYRRGPRSVVSVPMTLGHEVAGVVSEAGSHVDPRRRGERVSLHYQTSCGSCLVCVSGHEQLCAEGEMLGRGRDGGYAHRVTIPARNTFRLPDEISFEHAAVMMCSSATSFHALRKGRMSPGETVAVFGAGGLGLSAVQIALAHGASRVFAIDLDPDRLALAARFGAIAIRATHDDAPAEIRRLSGGGVDVALELVGSPVTARQSIESLRPMGRAVIVGISSDPVAFSPFEELALREAEVIGSMDHLAREIPPLLDLAVRGKLVLDDIVTGHVDLDADQINAVMDEMERFSGPPRTVIVP